MEESPGRRWDLEKRGVLQPCGFVASCPNSRRSSPTHLWVRQPHFCPPVLVEPIERPSAECQPGMRRARFLPSRILKVDKKGRVRIAFFIFGICQRQRRRLHFIGKESMKAP